SPHVESRLRRGSLSRPAKSPLSLRRSPSRHGVDRDLADADVDRDARAAARLAVGGRGVGVAVALEHRVDVEVAEAGIDVDAHRGGLRDRQANGADAPADGGVVRRCGQGQVSRSYTPFELEAPEVDAAQVEVDLTDA